MSAEANKYIADAAVTFYEMTEEDKIREQCEAREKYNWDMSSAIAKGKREGMKQGMERGMERGMKQGMERGMRQGKAEGMKQGMEQGKAEGMKQGKAEDRQEIAELIKRLTADNRLQELANLETDKDILQKLMDEYGI